MSSFRHSARLVASPPRNHRLCVTLAVSVTFAVLQVSAIAEPEQLTRDGILKRDPYFVDGGKALLYGYDEQDDLVRVLRLDLGTGKSEPFVPQTRRVRGEHEEFVVDTKSSW